MDSIMKGSVSQSVVSGAGKNEVLPQVNDNKNPKVQGLFDAPGSGPVGYDNRSNPIKDLSPKAHNPLTLEDKLTKITVEMKELGSKLNTLKVTLADKNKELSNLQSNLISRFLNWAFGKTGKVEKEIADVNKDINLLKIEIKTLVGNRSNTESKLRTYNTMSEAIVKNMVKAQELIPKLKQGLQELPHGGKSAVETLYNLLNHNGNNKELVRDFLMPRDFSGKDEMFAFLGIKDDGISLPLLVPEINEDGTKYTRDDLASDEVAWVPIPDFKEMLEILNNRPVAK